MRPLSCIALPAALLVLDVATAQSAVWSRIATPTSPGPRIDHVLVYDSARQVLVLHGGNNLNDTWEYDGNDWSLRSTSGPGAIDGTAGIAAAYDSQRQRTVLVHGNQNGTDTWEWDGATWVQRQPVGGTPPSFFGFQVAYDSLRGRTVMFGTNSDTYEWDGVVWRQVASGGPTTRQQSALTYDSARGAVLLYGGGYHTDTWEWNGSYWLEHFGIANPGPRAGTCMAYDPVRDRTVLYGGSTQGGNAATGTWEWDGTAWTQVATTGRPTADWSAAMAYDAARQRIVTFGGYPYSTSGELWAYAVLGGAPASFVTFGQGCSGPAAVPALNAVSGSLPRLGTTFSMTLSNLPNTPFSLPFGLIGSNNSTWNGQPLPVDLAVLGMPGCSAWIAPEVTFTLSNQNGSAAWGLAIPFAPPLLGTNFYTQGAVLAPGANQTGILVTNAGHGVVGPP